MHDPTENSEAEFTLKTVSLALLIINVGISIVVAINVVRWSDGYTETFKDFDVELPILTQIMLAPWTLAALAVLALLAIIKEVMLSNRRAALIINAIHLPFMLLIWQLHREAMLLPMIRLIDALS